MSDMRNWEELEAERDQLNAEVRELKRKNADLAQSWANAKDRFHRPSFLKMLSQYKDFISATASQSEFNLLPVRGVPDKIRNYAFAASHGCAIPKIYGVYPNIDKVDFEELPDRFVLKSAGGSTSHGVLPLVRQASDEYLLGDGSRILSQQEVRDTFKQSSRQGLAYGYIFAEEFLCPRGGKDQIPDDIKIYMSHGEVMHVMLRAVDYHGVVEGTRNKYVDRYGNDLGHVSNQRDIDPNIEVPANLSVAVDMAVHLSKASGLPFCRVDVFDTDRGVVFGELTRAPGGTQSYTAVHDERLGKVWITGYARLINSIKAGRPVGALWGHRYPTMVLELLKYVKTELPRVNFTTCEQWCE